MLCTPPLFYMRRSTVTLTQATGNVIVHAKNPQTSSLTIYHEVPFLDGRSVAVRTYTV